MSSTKSWFNSNILSGLNHGLKNVTKPFDWVDKKVDLLRKIPAVDHAIDYTRNHLGDSAAVAGAALGAWEAAPVVGGLVGGGSAGTAMGGAAGTLGAADSAGASAALGLTAGDVGAAGAVGDATAMGGAAGTLGAADSAAASSSLGLTAGDVSPNAPFVFNGAADSQAANEALNLKPVTTDDTLAGIKPAAKPMMMPQRKKQQQPQAVAFSPISGLSADQYQALENQSMSQIAQSSKTVKTRGATQGAMERGIAGAHPVDTNGVHIAVIQELNKQIEPLGTQIAAAKAKRSAKGA